MELITIAAVQGWWLLFGEPGKWRRRPLIGLAMVEDGGAPFVVGMTVPERELIELAEPGTYIHDSEFVECGCRKPMTELIDACWCRHCAGVVIS